MTFGRSPPWRRTAAHKDSGRDILDHPNSDGALLPLPTGARTRQALSPSTLVLLSNAATTSIGGLPIHEHR